MMPSKESSPTTANRQLALRRWYEEKSLRLLNMPSGDEATFNELLAEWPTLYPPWTKRLDEYDRDSFGPLLAVSDEGSAAPAIAAAAYASAKARALPVADAMNLGIIIDGERMTSAGEAPIGPDEYEPLIATAFGRTMCSTNVGVRANTRLYRVQPEFRLPEDGPDGSWLDSVMAAFRPFINTPDGKPRPLAVRIEVRAGISVGSLKALFQSLEASRKKAGLAPYPVHRFSLLLNYDREIRPETDAGAIKALLDAAGAAGFTELVLDGEPVSAARQRAMLPSLLNILDPASLEKLFDAARNYGVTLSYRYQLDAESSARTIWTGLQATRAYGFTAGKYGLVPLTLEEQVHVVESISRWMRGWTAIPAFYVDTALVTVDDIYNQSRCVEAAFLWMEKVRAVGARLVLVDCPDRVSPRHLVRDPSVKSDKGVLTLDQILAIDRHATKIGLNVLWSGGITARQAYTLAENGVLGIFSTSATARKIAVQGGLVLDPQLAVEGEPTEAGVRRVHAAIQCGFLSKALVNREALAHDVEARGLKLLEAIDKGSGVDDALAAADEVLIPAWKAHWEARPNAFTAGDTSGFAAPANAVRVWRGRRRKDLDPAKFRQKIGGIFIPVTVEMQRLFGLAAYLPAVLPANKPEMAPDEIALVFYKTQQSYLDTKKYPGGRAYSDMHELVFDLDASGSGFPDLLGTDFQLNQPWHLFSTPVDWQKGIAKAIVASRKKAILVADYSAALAAAARSVQNGAGAVDGAVLFANADWFVYWQHSPKDVPMPAFDSFADSIYCRQAQPTSIPPGLTEAWEGLPVSGGEFFNMQFPVV
ncbi:MAG TPA: hypothetical protein VHW24_26135 [Bryobacteraceae bacterium]|jgi:hypothetical protein|nr:hypothetical protein [Bryobacteraceae bacterium]